MGNKQGKMETLVDITSAYTGKRVFLTGHTGFKGSWMLKWLELLGSEVKGYALEPTKEGDLFNVISGSKICHSVIADIRNSEKLKNEILTFEPDFIFHLAAQPLVRLSYESPLETFDVNVNGTANVLDAVRYLKKPCVVICITTDKVYENKEWPYPYRETDRLGGHDPYSASKAAAEVIINSYQKSFFNSNKFNEHQKSISSARAGNVIGGGDWSTDRLFPDIIRAFNNKVDIVLRYPHAVRPWQHVLEPLFGYLILGVKMGQDPITYNGSWNFGPQIEDTLTVEEVVKLAISNYGSGNYIIENGINKTHEANLLRLDISKTVQKLGWKPKWNTKKAVNETLEWYSGKKDTLMQILEYINE